MYGVEWLIGLAVLGLLAGLGAGYLLARRAGVGGSRLRELEDQLTSARQELEDYRHEVVTQFSETARKFQTLNDSYTDLHRQLAKSSSILCGEVSGPLLAAPAGHQDLIPADIRGDHPEADGRAGPGSSARERAEPSAPERAEDAATPAREKASGRAKSTASDDPASGNDAAATAAAAPEAKAARPQTDPAPAGDDEPPTLRERVDRTSGHQDTGTPGAGPAGAPKPGATEARRAPDADDAQGTDDAQSTAPPGEGGNGRVPSSSGATPARSDPGSEIRIPEPAAADSASAGDGKRPERHAGGHR